MFSDKFLETLAEGLGEIARGCKKLKQCVLEYKKNPQKLPILNQSESENEAEETDEEEKLQSILDVDFDALASQYFNSNFLLIGGNKKQTVILFMDYCLDKRVRQDKFKNTWIYNSNGVRKNRKSWSKISRHEVEDLYKKLRSGWESLQSIVESTDVKPEHIHKNKWARRNLLLEIRLPKNVWSCKPFRKVTMNLHESSEVDALK
jgi:ribosome-associated toxin RatA of RatAB toxin-antitoxin module